MSARVRSRLRARLAASWVAFALCAIPTAVLGSDETPPESDAFSDAYAAYRAAADEGRYAEAAEFAAEAQTLAAASSPKDDELIAMLGYRHGMALIQARHHRDAYPVLEVAADQLRAAYGRHSQELMQAEIALATASWSDIAIGHLRRAVKIATRLGLADGILIANAKLMVGQRLRGRRGLGLVEEAAAAFDAIGQESQLAFAHLSLGRIRMANGWGEPADHFDTVLKLAGDGETARQRSLEVAAHTGFVELYAKQGRHDLATRHCLAVAQIEPRPGDEDPRRLYSAAPVYPAAARQVGREGSAVVEFTVDAQGIVRDPKVVSSEGGASFEEAALRSVEKWRYAPRFVNGKAVPVTAVRGTIKFTLGDLPRR